VKLLQRRQLHLLAQVFQKLPLQILGFQQNNSFNQAHGNGVVMKGSVAFNHLLGNYDVSGPQSLHPEEDAVGTNRRVECFVAGGKTTHGFAGV